MKKATLHDGEAFSRAEKRGKTQWKLRGIRDRGGKRPTSWARGKQCLRIAVEKG